MLRRSVITALGSSVTALVAGCGSTGNNSVAEETNSVTTTENTDSSSTNSTSAVHEGTTELSSPTESTGSQFDYLYPTGAELTIQKNISVRALEDVAEYDQKAGMVTMEGEMSLTVPLEEYLGKVFGHSLAASPVCDRYADVVTEYTELSTGRMCGTTKRDDQNMIVADVYESDSDRLKTDVVEALPETVHVTLFVEETETKYSFEYPVYVAVSPEFQLE